MLNPAETTQTRVLSTEVVIESLYSPEIHTLAKKSISLASACRVTWKTHVNTLQHLGSSCSFRCGLSPSCNEHAASATAQTSPGVVTDLTRFCSLHSALPWAPYRIPKMLAEQASLCYGLEKSESPRRKASMNTNRRRLKETFKSSGVVSGLFPHF